MGENFNVLGKIQTRTNFFRSNRKKLKIDKDGNESVVTISCKIKFNDSARFIASLLSSLVDNLTVGICKTKCRYCDCFLEYESVKCD